MSFYPDDTVVVTTDAHPFIPKDTVVTIVEPGKEQHLSEDQYLVEYYDSPTYQWKTAVVSEDDIKPDNS